MTTRPPVRVLAIDGTGVLVRCARAAQRTAVPLASSDGTPTGTLMMFISSLAKKVRVIRPDYAVIAWDGPDARGWRREACPDYKRNRPSAPATADQDQRLASDFCYSAGLRQLVVPGFEADDLLAAVQRQARQEMPGAFLDLLSDDADVLQLLSGDLTAVHVIGLDAVITELDVSREWGVRPEWLPMLRALAGDPSDNISGLPGVGLARARKMLHEARFEWPLPDAILPDPEQRARVAAWHSVMDLRSPLRRPEDSPEVKEGYFALKGQAEWHWEDPGALRIFLDRHELRRLRERLENGRLW